ncbi:hypothetical protein EMIHUDRAFT_253551 [Emiliania huxleyi CCMP1516]|uniref:Uncharacterized protein n=2 Tax=Emiliania huxleyi TaxID=2903 RepID=A0A0D3K6P4_EMIH1|nr:hypothetical protein EMIHUDRAFT_255994 [Emiliania huxleyi CCMP1516]XP_005783858.1 hypothetical protein EMIHUDRAFT_253551 [Emiliania huxleyi CCMP1516]EOD17149.1 hypothetical protein EMIHUDRAFT_255994 [Emiliania huxleyi CCMP1516]EOD31429.1 hypothetical protein EMIHUDRAFT_253551 [Emiliania huxleyi CCMP1516]|eukprot:XP_005769578.1 hypothetical protein EMIHUDRAFT_255994 [Emiliania huxleyi CCMP1516]
MRVLAAALSALSVSCVAGAPATEGAGARRKLGEDDGLVEVDLSELHKTTTAEEVRRQLTHYDTRVASGECEIRGYNDARCYYQGRWRGGWVGSEGAEVTSAVEGQLGAREPDL